MENTETRCSKMAGLLDPVGRLFAGTTSIHASDDWIFFVVKKRRGFTVTGGVPDIRTTEIFLDLRQGPVALRASQWCMQSSIGRAVVVMMMVIGLTAFFSMTQRL